MKKISPSLSLLLLVGFVMLTSATVIKPVSQQDDLRERMKKSNAHIESSLSDRKLTYQELKVAAEQIKGKKLSLREKLLLKIFGKKISKKIDAYAGGEKSQVVALLLCIFVGSLGIHRFYLGYTWQGVVQLLTLGGLGIWTLIDLIRIITGDLKPKDGEYAKTL